MKFYFHEIIDLTVERLLHDFNVDNGSFISGDNAVTEFNVTMTLPYQWNSSLCKSRSSCHMVKIWTCIELEAPAKLFPTRYCIRTLTRYSRKNYMDQCITK